MPIYFHNMDWREGDVKEVANDLIFPKESFEVQDAIEVKPKSKSKSE